jgi:hypothetical protein
MKFASKIMFRGFNIILWFLAKNPIQILCIRDNRFKIFGILTYANP